MTPEELATRAIKRQFDHLRPEVAERIAMFVTRPSANMVWRSASRDFEAMLDGWEEELRAEHYAGWTDDEIRTLVEGVSSILVA